MIRVYYVFNFILIIIIIKNSVIMQYKGLLCNDLDLDISCQSHDLEWSWTNFNCHSLFLKK